MLNFKIAILVLCLSLADCSPLNWIDKNCTAYCPNSAKPIKIKEPSSNGCGTFGVIINPAKLPGLGGFTPCCNDHDICYNTCNLYKDICDTRFKTCLSDVVSKLNFLLRIIYSKLPDIIYKAVATPVGCLAYINGFKDTCACP